MSKAAGSSATPTPLTIGGREWALLIVLATVWGASYFFGKVAVADIGPLTVVFGRVIVAAAILHAVIRARGVPTPHGWPEWRPFFVMGALNSAVPYSLIFWGETRISSGLAAILTAAVPIFTVIVAHFWTVDEKMTPGKAAGIGLGMAGVVIIMGGDLDSLASGSGIAKLAIVGATISYALSGIYGRRLKGWPPLVLAWGQMCAATLLMLLVDRPWATATWEWDAVLSILALATFSTAFAYMVFFRLLAKVGATNTSLVTFLIPVSSLLLGFAVLDEALVATQLLGMLLIVSGMAVIDGRLLRRFASPTPPLAERPAD
jgi:drug/metabolite transporter (DMT)-like permease